MKITTNNIGNYSLKNIAAKVQQKAVTTDVAKNLNISNKEKEFFSKMYPTQRDEIINYHFYSNKGQMSGVTVGKNIDRRM